MKLLRKEADVMDMSAESIEEHRVNTQIQEDLFEESELIEKEFEDWKRKRDEILKEGGVPRSKKRELERESRKYVKKLSAMATKLEFLSMKNKKEIWIEVKRSGEINS